ncbi:MAG: hypothetical protein HW378_4300, partial [Anaerolineales bacterium]|nr:hypothetical protein [Anaerolineales bacterium]
MSNLNPLTDSSASPADPAAAPVVAEASPLSEISPQMRRLGWSGLVLDLVLIGLLVIGIYFRFAWVNWNQDTDLHPDEYGLTGTLSRLAIPKSLGDYFNTRLSPMSPYQKYDSEGNPLPDGPESPMPDNRMRWGQWPLTLIRWAAEATDNTGYGNLRLLGRKLSALADSFALLVIFFIGWRLYRSHHVGLLAAALSGLAVMQIQQSHFMTADNFATLFSALAMYCAVRVAQAPTPIPRPLPPSGSSPTGEGESPPLFAFSQSAPEAKRSGVANGGGSGWGPWVWHALFGVFSGMAVASRINLVVLFGMILIAALIAHADDWQKGKADLAAIVLRLALAGVAALLTFRVTQPMSFRAEKGDTTLFTIRPNPEWVESMKVAQAESNLLAGGPPAEQWTNRPMIVFPFVNIVFWGMGLPLGLTAWAGFAWAAWRAAKTKDEWKAHLLPLVWAGGLFLFMGTRWVQSIRYFVPIYPFLALFAAWAIMELWRKKQEGRRGKAAFSFLLPSSLFLVVTLGTL